VKLDVSAHLVYDLAGPTDLLLQIEVPDMPDQVIADPAIFTTPVLHFSRVSAEDELGERIWIRAEGQFRCDYHARVTVNRPAEDISSLSALPPHKLPGEAVRYLMPSRFCPSDLFQSFVIAEFGHLQGGARIAEMRDWINKAFAYVPGTSNAQTTAIDSFVRRQGVCRDYAHVMVALARASTIPARFASVYAPGVTPQDFHAVAEVYLDGAWHPVDATGMASADTIARIGVGMDAAETAFLSSFGPMQLVEQSVDAKQVAD
jgi:transglutaminase-like putative cysteine protease